MDYHFPIRKRFTQADIDTLEKSYLIEKYPTKKVKKELSREIGRTTKSIQVWFQNRRAKEKRHLKEMEERSKKINDFPDQFPKEGTLPTGRPKNNTTSDKNRIIMDENLEENSTDEITNDGEIFEGSNSGECSFSLFGKSEISQTTIIHFVNDSDNRMAYYLSNKYYRSRVY